MPHDRLRQLAIPAAAQDLVLPYLELFIVERQLSDAKFGVAAVNDHRFMARLRDGRVTMSTVNRALAYARDACRGAQS